MANISREKIAIIHIAKKDLKLTEERYRELLLQHGGVTSSKDLSGDGAARLINAMVALGFKVRRKFSPDRLPRNAEEMVTPQQLTLIEHAWSNLAQYIPAALSRSFQRGFMERRLGLPGLGPQTRGQANKLIEALKNRCAQEAKKHEREHPETAA